MPGICAIADSDRNSDVSSQLDAMLGAMRHHAWYQDDRHVDAQAGLALGRVTLGFVNAAAQPVSNPERSLLVVMDGELYDAEHERERLRERGRTFNGTSHAEILLQGYADGGKQYFRNFHGSFVAAIWDAKRNTLHLVNDRFGMRPLYYAHPPGKLLVASSIRALMQDARVSREPNWRGLAQFFSFGQYLCQDTSLNDVRIVPPAAWVTYDVQKDDLRIEQYYRLEDDIPETPDPSSVLEQLDHTFKAAVDRRLQESDNLGLAISGGLDARTILAVVNRETTPLRTISYGIEGSLDHRCSAKMATIAGCRHVNHVLDQQFLANYETHLREMVHLSDGQYLSQCIIMPTLPVYRKLGLDVLIRGHAGELMHMHKAYAYSLDKHSLSISSEAQLETWLLTHLSAHMLQAVRTPLFQELSREEVERLARESLAECLGPTRSIQPVVQRVWHLFVTQRLRRETSLSLAKFGSVVETRVPYLDNDLVRLLMAVPPEQKLGESIQTYILQKRLPAFLKIVNSNTGARVGASPLSRRVNTFRLRALAKLGVRGYQPYERLGLWLRRDLVPMVESILLGDECLDRGVFVPDTVRSVVHEHLTKRHNHTYLLMAMLIYELGQRSLAGQHDFLSATPS